MKRFFLLKGTKKVYVTEATITVPLKPATTITSETVYEVVDATADGYILDVIVTGVKTDAKDAESRVYSVATEMLKDVHIQYLTDKEGKVTKVLNAEEGKKCINEMLDKLLSDVPLPQSTTLSDLRNQISADLNEESLLSSVLISTSPLMLNGKTISTGTEENYNTE